MIIPKELDYILSLQKRKDAKQRIKKVYSALLFKKGNSKDYFYCPSSYLKKVSSQYNKVINLFIEHKIIEYLSFGYRDIFNTERKKYYNTENGTCIKYKFLIDTTTGYQDNLDIDYSKLYDNERWYLKTRYSLLKIGFKPEELLIKRDNFSRRLHTNITGNIGDGYSYRDILSGGDYYVIDAKTSQPRLLWIHLNEIGLHDDKLDEIFNNNLDFYDYIIQRIPPIQDRDEAKELFTSWINGTGYLDTEKTSIRDLFSTANIFLRKYKHKNYKNVCRLLQYKEASIFIDDLLNNIPLEFCLTVHDSLIVRKEDVDIAYDFCKNKYPNLIFTKEEIKQK